MENPKLPSLKKEEFPKLLKTALDKMNSASLKGPDAIKRDLISGFQATGIYPVNSAKILDKLPHEDKSDDNQQLRENYQNSLLTFLKERRYANSPCRRKNKTRLEVAPGKSVSAAGTSQDPSSSDTEDDVEEEIAEEESESEDLEEEVQYENVDVNNIAQGQFLLVRILSGKRKSVAYRYAVIVQDVLADGDVNVQGLKSIDEEKRTFKEVEGDLFAVSCNDILAALPNPLVTVKTLGGRIKKYIFPKKVDIFEP